MAKEKEDPHTVYVQALDSALRRKFDYAAAYTNEQWYSKWEQANATLIDSLIENITRV